MRAIGDGDTAYFPPLTAAEGALAIETCIIVEVAGQCNLDYGGVRRVGGSDDVAVRVWPLGGCSQV